MLALAGTLILATLVSEDAACLAAAALIARGDLSAPVGIAACAVGIFAGDMALWAIGRSGTGLLRTGWFARRLTPERLEHARDWLAEHTGRAILMSRFTPGARLPMYVGAGLLRISPFRFAAWTLCAAVVWTPVIVLTAAGSVEALGAIPAGTGVLLGASAVMALLVPSGTTRIVAAVRARMLRLARWEFWPGWVFYAPVVLWVAALAVRYRSLTVLTACNPGIPDGGFVGESKFEILTTLPPEVTIPAAQLSTGAGTRNAESAFAEMESHGWAWPVVVKPDVGQRGTGVRRIATPGQLEDYLARSTGDLLIQPWHPGPFEAGIFYYRCPSEAHGRVFSITDKQFPVVVGDGRSNLSELITAHPRYRFQAALFLARHRDVRGRVLPQGERFQLTLAGNHAQGTEFRDGRHLLTPALERRIDEIARRIPGFFIGRFDVRYGTVEGFRSGDDLAIVELNGATAESTNIYDPDTPLLDAYRTLFRQWSLVFAIGAANRRLGARSTSYRRLVRLVLDHLAAPAPAFPVSD